MWFFRKKESPFWPVWLFAAAVFLLKSLFILGTSIRGLASTTWLIDDSFIEMKIARNLALGSGFSLDGINPTTGAPFFWIYLSSLNHMLFDLDFAIRATLIESNLLGVLGAVVVFFLAWKLTQDRRVAWTSLILSVFTLNAFFNGLNGMDTALFTLLALLTVATFFDVGKPIRWSKFQWGCVTGLFLGLTMMTRGDGIFVALGLGIVKLFEWWHASASERKEHRQSLLGIILVSGICFAAFITWQLLQTGSPLPGNQVGRRNLALDLHNFYFDEFSFRYAKIVVWNIFQLEELLSVALGSSLLALVALATGLLQKRLRVLAAFTVIYLGIFFALLVGYQWYFANLHGLRYINPGVHLLLIFIASLLWQLPVERWRKGAAITLVGAVILLAGYRHYQMVTRLPWAQYMSYVGRPTDTEKNDYFWAPLEWINENLPEGTIVGVRDYGRISLFTHVRVQDLAGNIDPDVAVALQDGTLKEYLKEKNVNYLFIPTLEHRPDKLYQYLHKELDLEFVPGAPRGTQNLYKINW